MTVLNTLQSISIIVASVITSGVVIYGVNAWHREYTGKRKLELAEEVLALFYEARDAIRIIRSPASYGGEGSTRNAAPNETPQEKQINDNAYIAVERYNKQQKLFNKIHSMRYRYMAQFSKDAAKPFDELNRIVNDILRSAGMLSHYWKEQGKRQWKSEEEFQQHLNAMHKQEAIFWEMSSDTDQITPRVEEVISDIEARCAKVIRKSK